MLGVTFGSKHSYNDWGIWLEDTHINPPLPKRYIVDVPARNGLLDLTPELTPTIRFENRTLTFNFRVKAGDWSTLVSQIYGDIHGRTLDVVSDLDPNWHWHGCVTVDDFSSDERTGVLVITVDAYPFKLSNTENSYTVNGDGTITCVVDRMEISPAFELTAPTTVIYGDSSYVLESTATTEKTLSGDIVSFTDGTANPAVDLTAGIEAVQDLHGYDHPWVGGAGKNKLPCRKTGTQTIQGLTVTFGSDGTITVNGTAEATTLITIASDYDSSNKVYLPTGTYTINGGQGTGYWVGAFLNKTSGAWDYLSGGNDTFTITEGDYIYPAVRIGANVTLSNLKLYPMIRLSTESATYEPYSNICPISGWDEVNVTRTGKNLIDSDFLLQASGWTKDSNGVYSGNSKKLYDIFRTGVPSYTLKGKQSITISFYAWNDSAIRSIYVYLIYTDGTRETVQVETTIRTLFQIHSNPTKDISHLSFSYSNQVTTHIDSFQIEQGQVVTDYVPYNGQTYTIDLDGTRYGGTLDVTTGVLTLTHGIVDLGTLNWGYITSASVFRVDIPTMLRRTILMCSQYTQDFSAQVENIADKTVWNYSYAYTPNNLVIKDSDYTDDASFKAMLTANNAQLVYELATPQVVQLTAEQVMILKNQNNIWADSGEVEVTYLSQDVAGKTFYIPDLELTEGSHELTIQGTGTTTVTYTNGRL